ncbi:hypothetical protein SAMN04489712_10679 [Thermomonospora echinospora]|uniref:Uncharacterized protein n=1 Tax=Thermomonospora echinospora TaxID=1992 RepID=A0A1H6AX33_9ACTN|nr:hypothetical protein [Thermomonospora echinospora]SEG53209.1 hypothetical protein SAMN04489712_10679 [Thermomonospora echinospora]
MTTPYGKSSRPAAAEIPTDQAVGNAYPPLKAGSLVRVGTQNAVVEGSEPGFPKTYYKVRYDSNKQSARVPGTEVFRRDPVEIPGVATPMPPSRDAMHYVFFDPGDIKEPDSFLIKFQVNGGPVEQKVKKTRKGLLEMRADDHTRELKSVGEPKVSEPKYGLDATFGKLAQMRVAEAGYDDEGLHFTIKIWCNAEHMAKPYDLMVVYLDSAMDTVLDTVAIISPPEGHNTVELEATYTWAQLCALYHVTPEHGQSPRAALTSYLPQVGIRVVWMDAGTTASANSINHYSGGMDAKHGTGVVPIRTITIEDLKESETVRKLKWNAAEPLRDHRPVYRAFSDLLQPGKELATTLEAESEFQVSAEQYAKVLSLMAELRRSGDLQKKFGIVKMERDKKPDGKENDGPVVCHDFYYDVPGYSLLKRKIVLRRRSVPANDGAGVFLFACKGASFADSSEKIRLATQCHLIPGHKIERLIAFLTDTTNIDNAFARVLRDALGKEHPLLDPAGWAKLGQVMTVVSRRTKYSLELPYATTVEFSADEAEVTIDTRTAKVYSIEFGVGHPGLQVLNTATTTASTTGSSSGGGTPKGKPTRVLVERPYHVPADLRNPDLFTKPDYVQYRTLRDQLLTHLFGSKPDLQPGGNKAHTLATILKLI